jgi:ribonuclease BN (tRNA processing enzyme)
LPVVQRYRQVLSQLQLRAFAPFPVQHVGRAYGIRVEGESGWKLVFSGDTRPAQSVGVGGSNGRCGLRPGVVLKTR